VRVPPWWTTFDAEPQVDGSLVLPYLDGLPAQSLIVRVSDGALLLGGPSAVLARLPCTDARVAAIRDRAGRVAGVEMWIRVSKDRALTVVARLGSVAQEGAE
jgi:hypothetical protein